MPIHYPYSITVQNLASWGKTAETADDATRDLLKTMDVSGAALIALLGKLFEIGEVLRPEKMDRSDDARPSNAKVISGINVGDRSYTYEVEGGLSEYIVVSVDDEGYAKDIELGSEHGVAYYICGDSEPDKGKAIRTSIEEDINWHTEKLADLHRLKEKFERGENVDDGIDSVSDDE